MITDQQKNIIDLILEERMRQDAKFGQQNHHPVMWNTILMEEVGEASKEMLDLVFVAKTDEEREHTLDKMYVELVQVAAVAMSMLECIERNHEKLVKGK